MVQRPPSTLGSQHSSQAHRLIHRLTVQETCMHATPRTPSVAPRPRRRDTTRHNDVWRCERCAWEAETSGVHVSGWRSICLWPCLARVSPRRSSTAPQLLLMPTVRRMLLLRCPRCRETTVRSDPLADWRFRRSAMPQSAIPQAALAISGCGAARSPCRRRAGTCMRAPCSRPSRAGLPSSDKSPARVSG